MKRRTGTKRNPITGKDAAQVMSLRVANNYLRYQLQELRGKNEQLRKERHDFELQYYKEQTAHANDIVRLMQQADTIGSSLNTIAEHLRQRKTATPTPTR